MPFIAKHFYFYYANNKKICRRYQFEAGCVFFTLHKKMYADGVCSQLIRNVFDVLNNVFFVAVGSSNEVRQREFQSKLNSKTMTKKLQEENV